MTAVAEIKERSTAPSQLEHYVCDGESMKVNSSELREALSIITKQDVVKHHALLIELKDKIPHQISEVHGEIPGNLLGDEFNCFEFAFGLILSGLITVWIPQEVITGYLGGGLSAMLVMPACTVASALLFRLYMGFCLAILRISSAGRLFRMDCLIFSLIGSNSKMPVRLW